MLSGVSDNQLLAGVEEGYLRRMASQDSALPAARSELQMEVEESYREAIRSVKTFRETLQRTMDGVAYATREIDPNMNKVFWAAGIRSNELEVQLEHWERVQARILDQCGAYQARRVARSVASGNTVRLAMEDASASEIAQQTGLRVEDVAAALNQASDLARESDEDEDDTNGLNGYANGSNGNGHNGNGHNASDATRPWTPNSDSAAGGGRGGFEAERDEIVDRPPRSRGPANYTYGALGSRYTAPPRSWSTGRMNMMHTMCVRNYSVTSASVPPDLT